MNWLFSVPHICCFRRLCNDGKRTFPLFISFSQCHSTCCCSNLFFQFIFFLTVKGKDHSSHCFQDGLSHSHSGERHALSRSTKQLISFSPPQNTSVVLRQIGLGQKAVFEYLKLYAVFYLSSDCQNVLLQRTCHDVISISTSVIKLHCEVCHSFEVVIKDTDCLLFNQASESMYLILYHHYFLF